MAQKFFGNFAQLHDLTEQLGMRGTWEPEPNGVYMLRCECGVNMHWASGSKSVWFDGPAEAKRQLAARLNNAMLPMLPEH